MKMKALVLSIATLCISECEILAADDHLAESRSPLIKNQSPGCHIPGTYGGDTAVILDLDQVGTDKMLSISLGDGEMRPHLGENFRIHSDKTTLLKGGDKIVRRVLLVNDEYNHEGLDSFGHEGFKMVFCYKITRTLDTWDEDGRKSTSEGTMYSLAISHIRDELDIVQHGWMSVSFSGENYPKLFEQLKGKQPETATPNKPPRDQ